MDENFFAERLSQLRIKKDVSARDMSLSIGQSESYVNKLENKHSQTTISMFFCICEYLGVTPKEFFDVDVENPNLLNEAIEELRKLDEQTLKNLLKFMREYRTKNSKI